MCVARKSGPGREYSVAVDWRDCAWSPRIVVRRPVAAQLEGVLPKSFSASDVGQTFLSAGSGDFPVPGFRVKLSALVCEVGKLRNRQARKPALQFGQHAPGSPFKNAFSRSSRGNEAQISLETIIRSEPPHVGCYFFNGPPGCVLCRLVTKRSPASSSISPPPRRNRIYF
jgi:hypothetical protein